MGKTKKSKNTIHGLIQGNVYSGLEWPKNYPKNARGAGWADAFLSGLTAPFRAAASINPVFGFGVDKAADALNIPTVSDVISGKR